MPNELTEPADTNVVGSALLDFTNAVSAITSSHRELQRKIEDLDFQLAQKNSELQKSLAETQRLKSYLDCILDSMSNGLVVVDKHGRITVFNRAAQKLTGYQAADAQGVPYSEVFGNHTSERFTPFHTLKTHSPVSEGEKEISTKEGRRVPVKFSTSLLTDLQHRTLGAIEVLNDLSAVRTLEEQMQRIKIIAALTDMAAVVAHEIRNPLSGIGGYAALLTDDLQKEDPKHNMAEQIIEGVRRLDEIVNNLLLLARPEEPSFVEVELGTFLECFLSDFDRQLDLHAKHVVLNRKTPDPCLKAEVDPGLLRRALWNVADNAVRAMPDGGTLRVELTAEEDEQRRAYSHVCIRIADTGIGMSRKTLNRLFVPFFTTRERGTGLGSAIAKNLIKFQRGDIRVESRVGKGTTVTILLPILEESDG